MKTCLECNRTYPLEDHHIIYRSHGGLNIDWNLIRLCTRCHKGDKGPHQSRETDLRYKRNLQKWLQSQLIKSHYTEEGLQKALSLNQSQTKKILKTIRPEKEGYSSEQVIFKLMGERMY